MHTLMSVKNVPLVIIGFLIAAVLIYMTPLRYTALIEPTVRDIDPVEFHQMLVANPDKYIFIDVRSQREYDLRHAEGSQLMPLHTLFNERKNLPKRGKEIILICTGGAASGVGYSYLEHYGFSNIYRIEGGINAWDEAGMPTIVDIGI